MKTRNFLVVFILIFAMLLVACGGNTLSLTGTWKGTFDFSETIEEQMKNDNPELFKYINFDSLEFTYVFEFTEKNVKLSVDKESVNQFLANMKKGIADMVDTKMADVSIVSGQSAEELYAGLGSTREAYIQSVIDGMALETTVQAMAEGITTSGTYEYDDEQITIYYNDNTYEEMEYSYSNETLKITITDGKAKYPILFYKEK